MVNRNERKKVLTRLNNFTENNLEYLLVPKQKKSIFWQVIDLEGKKHYLFGTIHTDDNRVLNFNSVGEQFAVNYDSVISCHLSYERKL